MSDKHIKVALLSRNPAPGQFSIETCFRLVAAELQAIGCNAEIKVPPVRSSGLLRRLRILLFARSLKHDVIHVTGDITFAAVVLSRSRTVITIHDCEVLERTRGLKHWILKKFWFEIPARHATAVTVISSETKQQLLSYIPELPEEKIHIIPTATSDKLLFTPKITLSETPRILQIGTKPNKNVPRLIEALSGLGCHLTIVGKCTDEVEYALQSAELKYELKSQLTEEQLAYEYIKCDIVAFVSLHEGFGMPIIESHRVGRPVVTSNCSSMPEVAGEAALLVDPTNTQDIRSAFKRLISSKAVRDELVNLGKENTIRFSTGSIAVKYQKVYKNALKNAH